ncbi:hypothetical protein BOTBODRAFT_179057 [Botryobasidium botryosum FD-172 SS1]|uniref:Major facilitator superfamily (MFS) profile domain-containing protein n=1 Tax=Botryobasidium botryosum (strain FD-172 SS1) TaxID=930990 RepID=A0A067MBW9_BOTB1|nr:hypothetical protein BOTBODRAFT_179057 [Botryobasidium botryosum FD-172 SS1]
MSASSPLLGSHKNDSQYGSVAPPIRTGATTSENTSADSSFADPNDGHSVANAAKKERIALYTLAWSFFLLGWVDGSIGPLLPAMQAHYQIGYTVISIIFVSGCVGFVIASVLNIYLTDKFGFGKIIVFSAICEIVSFALQASAPSYPLMVLAFAINGFAFSLQDSQCNGFVVQLSTGVDAKLGVLHAIYGLGAFCAPLVATQFSHSPRYWSLHYLVSFGMAIVNLIALVIVFRLKNSADTLSELGVRIEQTTALENSGKFLQMMKTPMVHVLAFFIFVYCGTEITIGGWAVTYILDVRHGGKASGYISSGFFGGLALGRVALIWVNEKIGQRRVILLYTIIAIALEISVWRIPSLIENAIAISLIGLVLGPFFPICMSVAGEVLPRRLVVGSIGWISGFGTTGGSAFPFITGALASKYGVKIMPPLLVGMTASMLILWLAVGFQKESLEKKNGVPTASAPGVVPAIGSTSS